MVYKKGQEVLVWNLGEWRNATYDEKLQKSGEHMVTITPKNPQEQAYSAKVIHDEIRYFL